MSQQLTKAQQAHIIYKLDSTGTISDFQCLNKNMHIYTSLYHKRQITKDSLKYITGTIFSDDV